MKIILTLTFSLFLNVLLYGKCANSGISIFPNKTEISQNSIFLIEGFDTSQKIINSLNKNYKIYLQSENQKINLIVTETLVGDFKLTQALLKPEIPLEVGKEYTLKIDNLPKFEFVSKFNSFSIKKLPIKYKVTSKPDLSAPNIGQFPYEIKKSFISYGCGPTSNVIFSFFGKDDSELLVKTTVKNLASKKETIFYLFPEKNKIYVGYGMCSGAFKYDDNLVYEVKFDFMDSSGNTTSNQKKIRFTKPTIEKDTTNE